METQDSYDTRQAKQKASVKWLLSKAFNNKVPENLREPFYRDHENQEYLKPQILGSLANAELYCLALGNIYSDPNYHNLNHGSIIQTFARKGVLNEPSEVQLTETVLIQTNPLRMTAHMAVIEAMMALYAKEVVTGDRVIAAVQRFNPELREIPFPQDHDKGLLLWVEQACLALKQRVQASGNQFLDDLRPINNIEDLFDGLKLACLVSYYCPDELPSDHLVVNRVPSVSDTVYNLNLVFDFCRHCLPYPVFHLTPEDVTYLKRTMKQNLIAFLADMFNVLEIHPVKCVRYPGADRAKDVQYPSRNTQGVMHKRSVIQTVISPIPDLRSSLDDTTAPAAFQVPRPQSAHMVVRKTSSLQTTPSETSTDNVHGTREQEDFVVHRGRAVPTLSSVLTEEALVPARMRPAKEKQNNDTKAEEMDDSKRYTPAGKPSNWDDKKTSYAGRRSRRNSVSDDSQLTIENFGGSQEHLNMIGRNPDKELTIHSGRKISAPSFPVHEPFESNLPIRSKLSDSRSNIHLGYDSDNEKQDREKESMKLTRQLSSDAISLKNILHSKQLNRLNDSTDGELPQNRLLSFADISKQNQFEPSKNNQTVYMLGEEENIAPPPVPQKPVVEKKTTFAALPNTTTWQQQSNNVQQLQQQLGQDDATMGQQLMTSQLNDIRMKLEEKRKHIENEKKKIELVVNRQRQKVGKAAFLQAINKGKSTDTKSPSGSSDSAPSSEPRSPTSEYATNKPMTDLQDLTEDAMSAEIKRLISQQENIAYNEPVNQHIEMDIEHYHQTIDNSRMNSSLQEMHVDIQRLAAQQQHQLNQLKTNDILLNEQKQQLLRQQMVHPQQMYHMQQLQQPQPSPQSYYNNSVGYGSPNQYMSMTSVPQYASPPPDNQFYLHDHPRRTWKSPQTNNQQGFMLHEPANETHHELRYQNGDHRSGFSLSQQHSLRQNQSVHSEPNTPQRASPQHRVQSNNVHRQISQLMGDGDNNKTSFATLAQISDLDKSKNQSGIHHAIPTPPVDDMEPQNISFIGNAEDSFVQGISKLNISSGTRTYRIPSPTRPHISRNSFQPSEPQTSLPEPDNSTNEKGFYISFDNEQPKKPKPPLRLKRGSPKKDKPSTSLSNIENEINVQGNNMDIHENMARERHKSVDETIKNHVEVPMQKQKVPIVESIPMQKQDKEPGTALIIGNELKNLDPNSVDEMERKKERIMLLSLQRRQKQEELKEKKEAEMQAKREKEKQKEEDRLRRKQEQEARRLAILEQHKLKKAIEEAEREGKVLDKEIMGTLNKNSATKMRSKATTGRPRPKTIHVDSGSVEMAEGMLQPSQGKKGSTTNLSVNTYTPSATLRRDYYRGSQDSLADRSPHGKGLYRENHGQVRDRPKYPTIQTFKGRKSNSMMNLYGSSSDQDSMAYRYGDTDSGLGRATPPRRAPSPGMGGLRHLPSPSGPGSLPPGLASRRRNFDDGCSDASSTPSSMLGEYTGPRLYKQPATKSNRGIMLNAVEYCVFPGVVNREAKQRVLEEIARSESKHFLILFRDAGCQFRALYSYCPDRDEVLKLYGTGPKQVNDKMFDRFFKYNSGGKCFSQVHTKHLTVTIDAFTIHNSLWQGKKVNLPSKKDMALVI